ncbi:MAG: twin-arginine translocase subunit TatC [Candidatus Saccharimonadales bacterium]
MAALRQAAKRRTATTFHDHLKELRNRAFVVVAFFLVASSLAYTYKDPLLSIIMKPLDGEKLIYLTPGGGFAFIFQVSLYAGIVVTIPVLIYSIFRFLSPVLSRKVQTVSVAVVLSSMVLLAGGVSFGYFFAIPAAMNFLIHFADGFANASLTAESYLGFVMAYTTGLGILFQLPLILLFIHWVHPLKPKKLFSFERYVVLFAFVIAAIISPTPDALNQTIIAVPIVVMYQLGVFAIMASLYRQKRRDRLTLKRQARQQRHRETKVDAPVVVTKSVATRKPMVVVAKPAVIAPAAKPTPSAAVMQPSRRTVDGFRPSGVRQARQTAPLGSVPARPLTPSVRLTLRSQQASRSIDGVSIVRKSA